MGKYETKDIWLSSALMAREFNCDVEKLSQGQSFFIFTTRTETEYKELLETINNYNRGNLLVDVSEIKRNYQILKNLIYKK